MRYVVIHCDEDMRFNITAWLYCRYCLQWHITIHTTLHGQLLNTQHVIDHLRSDSLDVKILAVRQRILVYLLSDGSRVSRHWMRWILSFGPAHVLKKCIELEENTLGFYKQAALQHVRIHWPFSRFLNLGNCPPFSRCPDLSCVVQQPPTLEPLTASTHLKPRS